MTRDQLDRSPCETPDCGHDHSVLYFHARCHPRADVEARYEKATGECVISCATCRKEVVRLDVAKSQ